VEPAGLRTRIIMLRHIPRTHANLHLMTKHITSQDSFLIRGRSECRKGLSESVKVVENWALSLNSLEFTETCLSELAR
jgi:hypothetical protein